MSRKGCLVVKLWRRQGTGNRVACGALPPKHTGKRGCTKTAFLICQKVWHRREKNCLACIASRVSVWQAGPTLKTWNFADKAANSAMANRDMQLIVQLQLVLACTPWPRTWPSKPQCIGPVQSPPGLACTITVPMCNVGDCPPVTDCSRPWALGEQIRCIFSRVLVS